MPQATDYSVQTTEQRFVITAADIFYSTINSKILVFIIRVKNCKLLAKKFNVDHK